MPPGRFWVRVIRLDLNIDYDRLHELVSEHRTLREMLGHGAFEDVTYHFQTLKDNVSLLTRMKSISWWSSACTYWIRRRVKRTRPSRALRLLSPRPRSTCCVTRKSPLPRSGAMISGWAVASARTTSITVMLRQKAKQSQVTRTNREKSGTRHSGASGLSGCCTNLSGQSPSDARSHRKAGHQQRPRFSRQDRNRRLQAHAPPPLGEVIPHEEKVFDI